jgi:hypothetical protein
LLCNLGDIAKINTNATNNAAAIFHGNREFFLGVFFCGKGRFGIIILF